MMKLTKLCTLHTKQEMSYDVKIRLRKQGQKKSGEWKRRNNETKNKKMAMGVVHTWIQI